MLRADSMEELVREAGDGSISRAVLADQAERDGVSRETLLQRMLETLQVMRESAQAGLSPDVKSMSGMTGGQAAMLFSRVTSGAAAAGPLVGEACAVALGVAELNAAMGRIVAAPTAGPAASCRGFCSPTGRPGARRTTIWSPRSSPRRASAA